MRQINFLEASQFKSLLNLKKDRKILIGSIVGLILVVVIWIGCLFYNIALVSKNTQLTAEANKLEAELSKVSSGQVDYITFVSKLKTISSIIKMRNDSFVKIDAVGNYIEQDGIVLRNVNYSMHEAFFSMNYNIENVFYLQDFFVKMNAPEFKSQFKGITYGSLGRSSNGDYSMNVVFNL